jgi:hypothetical protein
MPSTAVSPDLFMELLRSQIDRGQVQAVELAEARQALARVQLDLVAMRDLVAAKAADVIAAREALEAAKEFSADLQARLQLAEATIGRQKRAPGVLARLFRRGNLH